MPAVKEIQEKMRARAGELLRDGGVSMALGWKRGEFCHDPEPAFFESEAELDNFVYDGFSSPLLSKYLIETIRKDKQKGEGKGSKFLVFLKPCDSYGLNLLLKEHRVERERVYAVGVGCPGMLDVDKIRAAGVKNMRSFDETETEVTIHASSGDKTLARRDILLEKCLVCKGPEFAVQDEVLAPGLPSFEGGDRFAGVTELESMSPEERFSFWRNELSRCIRCNACRNACPVCSCNKCVFDNPQSGVQAKSNADSFEENMFHIVRAFHVAGRCSDCGECSRVCPQKIPLHLLNRKFIKDINAFYGAFQAGADAEARAPLTNYEFGDVEPGAVVKRGGGA
ncbi:MAG: 4Fe-4S dicluster domain-containing protein [Synergistaceae bacterium]|jgi:ferredoxin|nr:4Fe-4S dicluster domain-containing protein [Synergistaceae bacterium]